MPADAARPTSYAYRGGAVAEYRHMKSLAILIAGTITAAAAGAGEAGRERAANPVVVELFTSQSCSSCVAAAEYFEDLAARDDVIALGWHVDYWNALQTRHGRWVDPYSDAAYTERQRRYNRNLRATNAVYTPQIVINGAGEAIGSARGDVEALIRDEKDSAPSARVASVQRKANGDIAFNVSGEGEVVVVYFTPVSETAISGGENAGQRLNDINIVTDFALLGDTSGAGVFSAAAPSGGENCAVLLQAPNQGRILAARYCPQS